MTQPATFALWRKCQEFVGAVCATRDPTHGLSHMQEVTELSLLVHSMQKCIATSPTAAEKCAVTAETTAVPRIIVVAMLHDVNDHKYDLDGTLNTKVEEFLKFIEESEPAEFGLTQKELLQAIVSISYSKEKKNGMRWFEEKLPVDWVYVRDVVSDADKLTAIGLAGLERCFTYQVEMLSPERLAVTTPLSVLQDVRAHSDEKLLRLNEQFIVTPGGKFLGSHRHVELEAALHSWESKGIPVSMQNLLKGSH
jgi:5'-deoxynucleotidase YfbR-like HD superfamily hydrolase